jgi:hypothetical protein
VRRFARLTGDARVNLDEPAGRKRGMLHSVSLARGDTRSPKASDPTTVASRDPIAMSQAPSHTHERNMQ